MQRTNSSGIYEIVHVETGRRYVGSAKNLASRKKTHFVALRSGSHHNSHLQSAWLKYGEDAFMFRVIDYCDKSELIAREQQAFKELNPEFNINKVAGSRLGMRHRQETIEKLKSRIVSDETKRRMSESQKGRVITEEHRKNISAAQKGVAKPRKKQYIGDPQIYTENMQRTNFYFPQPLLDRFRAMSKATGTTVSELIRRAMAEFLERNK